MKSLTKIAAVLTFLTVSLIVSNSYAETFVKGRITNNQVLLSVGHRDEHPNNIHRKKVQAHRIEVKRDNHRHNQHQWHQHRPKVHYVVNNNYYPRKHAHYGARVSFLPSGYKPVWAGRQFYYLNGDYYVKHGFDYIVVEPPVGVIVSQLPYDYHPVVINGGVYYLSNGAYYISTPQGYQVVTKPVPVVYVPESGIPTVTINVPNNNGGYTSVILKKASNGYIGPQGEFYPEMPAVNQLQAMYAN